MTAPQSRPHDAPARWGTRFLWGLALVAALSLIAEFCTGRHAL